MNTTLHSKPSNTSSAFKTAKVNLMVALDKNNNNNPQNYLDSYSGDYNYLYRLSWQSFL